MAERDNTEVRRVSFVGYTGGEGSSPVLFCGTYKTYTLYLRKCKYLQVDLQKLVNPQYYNTVGMKISICMGLTNI